MMGSVPLLTPLLPLRMGGERWGKEEKETVICCKEDEVRKNEVESSLQVKHVFRIDHFLCLFVSRVDWDLFCSITFLCKWIVLLDVFYWKHQFVVFSFSAFSSRIETWFRPVFNKSFFLGLTRANNCDATSQSDLALSGYFICFILLCFIFLLPS